MPLDDLPGPKTTPARREETDPTMNPDVTVTSEIVVLIMALSSHDDAEHIRYDHVKETIKLFHKWWTAVLSHISGPGPKRSVL